MTLPTIIADYKEKVLVTQVKKSYSQLQNALKMYAVKNECSDSGCISDVNGTNEDITRKLYEQFKGAKYCESNSKFELCKGYNIKGNTPQNDGTGTVINSDGFSFPFFISSDGAIYQLRQRSQCITTSTYNKRDENGFFVDEDGDGVYDTVTTISDSCARLYFDANGPLKGPNQFGADVYRLDIRSDGKLYISTTQLSKTLTTDKLYYTPHNLGGKIEK